jgi:YesN/AraC family two-component response regulator
LWPRVYVLFPETWKHHRRRRSTSHSQPEVKLNSQPQVEVLFVDDEEGVRVTLQLVLRSYGFSVTAAATVPEALSLIASRKFDVLIADLNIGQPGDGFTVVSAMRRTQPEVVTFILTGYPAFETALEAIQQQVDDYLIKPTETETLVEKIKSKLLTRNIRNVRHAPTKRVAEIVVQHRDSIVESWLQAVRSDPQLMALSLADEERIDHIPRLIEEATRAADPSYNQAEAANRAATSHGTARYRQGYTIPMMVKEAAILEEKVGACVQNNLLALQVSFLIPDLVRLSKTIIAELGASVEAFLEEEKRMEQELRTKNKRNRDR